jgi:nucleoside-diphosphate-sugar epimerase
MLRRRYSYLQAAIDFAAFLAVTWGLVLIRPSIARVYGPGLIATVFPFLVPAILVSLLYIFRQYRFRRQDRFLRQFGGAFNVVTLGFLLIVVISFDTGAMVSSERGTLFLLLLLLLAASAVSRVITHLWMGQRLDFSLKEPVVLKHEAAGSGQKPVPLVLPASRPTSDIKRAIEDSPFDFAVLTDDDGYFAGTITDGDIIEAHLAAPGHDRPVSEIMNRHYPVTREDLSAGRMHQMMIERNLRFLPIVTNEGKPLRTVLLSDLDALYRRRTDPGYTRRILIIGGAGYIGSVMVRFLLKRGYSVSVLDSLMFGYDALKELDNHPAYRFFKLDSRNIQDLLTAMADVDTVVHLAAIVGDPACELDHRATIDINYEASKILVDACRHKKVQRLLFASTCSVYGASINGELLSENSPLNPVSLYAETKLRSEEALMGRAEPPLAVTVFRLATVFGFSYRPRFDLVVNTLTARAIEDGEISIFGGSQWRPNVHVLDVVRAFAATIEAPREAVDRQILNLGSETQNYRIAELGDMVKQEVPQTKIKTVDAAVDKRDYRVCFDKIEKTLNWRATVTVRDGIQEIIDAYSQGKVTHYGDKIYSNLKHLQ